MTLVSIISDYGTKEFYLGYLKATLLGKVPEIQIIDITHEIPMEDLGLGAYQLRSALPAFPKNSIHLVCINEFLYGDNGLVIARKDGKWIIAPNNGFLSLLHDKFEFGPVYHRAGSSLDERYLNIAKVIYALCHQYGYIEALRPAENLVEKINLLPVIAKNTIRAKVFHVDNFGNLILNLNKSLFSEIGTDRDFEVEFRKHTYRGGLKESIGETDIGELACTFNLGGHMVISAFQDKANEILQVDVDDIVNVNFLD